MKISAIGGLLLALFTTSACSEDEAEDVSGGRYAIMYEIYDNEDSNSYLSILDSLDLKELDPKKGREFAGGRAFLATYGGAIFIGSPTEPVVTRYTVSSKGELTPAGELSFGNYGVSTGSLDAWNVTFIDEHKAYLLNFEEGNTLIWDPTEMEIIDEIPAPDELFREGFVLDGSPAFLRGNKLFRSFHFADFESYGYSEDALLVIYDTDNDEVLEVVPQTRCPALGNLLHQDETGAVYFSNWIWPVAGTLMYDAPESCVLRINPDSDRFDEDWELRYSDVFDGRQGAQFSYLADRQALAAVFHDEDTSFDAMTDPWDYAGRPVWRISGFDLDTQETTQVEGIEPNTGAFTPIRLDDRQFLMVPGADWAATDIYELTGNEAEHKVHIPGWSYQFVKIR